MQPTDPNKFTDQAWDAIIKAQDVARRSFNQQLEVEHVAIALLEQQDLASKILVLAGVDVEKLARGLQDFTARQPTLAKIVDLYLGRGLDSFLDRAEATRSIWKDRAISIEHLILELVNDDRIGRRLLTGLNCDRSELEVAIKQLRLAPENPDSSEEILSGYVEDLTEAARFGKIDPMFGRDEEICHILEVLSCRRKNSLVLIGKPGVGKTAIVGGLAQRIISGDVPASFRDCQIISLDLGALIAGARFPGDFEERLRSLLAKVTKSNTKVILFIDELHDIVGKSIAENAVNGIVLLKSILARGKLRCIGATTTEAYLNISQDPSIEMLFQPVRVNEPSVEDTISILRGLKECYEIHHGVKIGDPALVSAAVLSSKYVSNRSLPDKAIDLVDLAAAKVKMEIDSKPKVLDKIEREAMQLEMEVLSLRLNTETSTHERRQKLTTELADLQEEQRALNTQWQSDRDTIAAIQIIEAEIDAVNVRIRQAEQDYNLNTAAELKYTKLAQLEQNLTSAKVKLTQSKIAGTFLLREEVSESDIVEIVSRWTEIPVNQIIAE
jgi:ATP-dependent Clp protease ATP-binding subunit ClpB